MAADLFTKPAEMSLGCAELDQHVTNWLKWDKNEKDRKEVEELVAKKDIGTLRSRIRSRMEAGFSRLNDLTVLMLTNGFALHLKEILAPHDTEICRIAYANMEPKPEFWDLSKLHSHPLLHSADPVIDDYFADEQSLCRY
uniref:Uncharacterized protein n=1 Tax=Parascaris equorum TaxID=6256 RepID=A0A914RL27_PAREQ